MTHAKPIAKTPAKPTFRFRGICNFIINGMGRMRIQQSVTTLKAEFSSWMSLLILSQISILADAKPAHVDITAIPVPIMAM